MPRVPLLSDPIAQFIAWFDDAKKTPGLRQADATCLSTVDPQGFPDGRMVLLKGVDVRGFVFYTNVESVKGQSLEMLPRAALTFHWEPLKRQVRVQGTVEKVSDAEADAYWKTRARLSQIGAWASVQSRPLDSNRTFIKRLSERALRFGTSPIPRPPYWSGFRVIPHKIEFWRSRRGRLHERFLYERAGSSWLVQRLYP